MLLLNPARPAAPTIAVQIVLDTSAALPRVGETPTLGYPYDLESLTISAPPDSTLTIRFKLLVAINPYVSGDGLDGYHLVTMAGDDFGTDPRQLVYRAAAPLTLTPRIRVPFAGSRLRIVQDVNPAALILRVVFVLQPYN